VSVALIATALWLWGAKEVRGNVSEVSFLTFIGIVWLLFGYLLFPWIGLSPRDDAFERKNPAATIALSCALFSIAITFAAGNLGEGPSYWENIFCAALATGGLFGLWLVMELGSHVSISIAEERDFASGLRFGGLLIALGLVLGRAVTGNWHSASDSVYDFIRDGWPTAIICLVAFVVELFLRPNRLRPFPSWPVFGLVPALLYLLSSIVWLWHLGRWEGMPQ
jgi:uncharacterized membrane protein YjfL (UPF0719 family)